MKDFMRFLKDENGQGMVEYGLILGLIAIAAIGALFILGPKISTLFGKATDALSSATAS